MLSAAQLRQDRKPESAHRLVYKRHAHALESNETVTGGSRVKAGCVSDTLHLNQLLPSCCSTAPWSFYIHDKLMERAWLQIRKRSGFCFSCMTLLFLTFTPFSGFLSFFSCFFVSLLFSGSDVCLRHTHQSKQDEKQHRCEIMCYMFRRTGSTRGAGHTIPSRGCWLVETRCVLSKSWHCPRSFKSPVHLHQPSHPSPPLTPSSLSLPSSPSCLRHLFIEASCQHTAPLPQSFNTHPPRFTQKNKLSHVHSGWNTRVCYRLQQKHQLISHWLVALILDPSPSKVKKYGSYLLYSPLAVSPRLVCHYTT